MFKVLVIAYYYPPLGLSGVQRTLKFVKYMKDYNWEPVVLTTGNIAYFAHDYSLLKESNDAGVRVVRSGGRGPNSLLSKFGTMKIPPELIRKLINRVSQAIYIPDNKISWAKAAYKTAEKLLSEEKFNAIFVTGPPFSAFVLGSRLKKDFNIPLFLDYRDLWFGSYFSFYMTPFHKLIQKRNEYLSLKSADRIFVTNRKIKENILNYFPFLTFEDIVILPHGYDAEDFEKLKPIPKHNDKMIITYSGIFVEYNSPKYFIRAFKKLSIERPDVAQNIELHFVGFLRKENKKLIKKLKLESFVKDHGYMNHGDSIIKIKSSDILWIMVGRKKNIDAILPGKLYEYFGSLKPIIACVPEGAAKIAAKEYGACFITEPDDIDQIKNTILEVYESYKKNQLPQPDENYVAKYRRDFLTEQLTKQMQFMVKDDLI
ncbi:MAG: glycosyltransferase [Ignavibacteriaceae bacterium]|nr:glycosyltransferase [Ignavibacteriaceae bacterium]